MNDPCETCGLKPLEDESLSTFLEELTEEGWLPEEVDIVELASKIAARFNISLN